MTGTAFGPQGPNYTITRPPADPQASAGADTFFKNCSAAGAKDGTFATADFFNMNLANLRYLVRQAGIPLNDADDTMVYQAVKAIADAEIAALVSGGSGGSTSVGYLHRQSYTAHGAYAWVCPVGVIKVFGRVWGAGGGGGGANSSNFAQGGGGGGLAEGIFTVVPGTTYIITVGQGGAFGTTIGGPGLNGGSSSFSSFASATGGIGGNGDMSSVPVGGFSIPTGGSGTGGDSNYTGGTGGVPVGTWTTPGITGGNGGGAPKGGAGGVAAWDQQGQAGVAPGGGGGGASANYYSGGSANPGNVGAEGEVELTWVA
jgi:hypothetical protein